MEIFKERFHLLTLLVNEDDDLVLIREKTALIVRMGRFFPDGEEVAETAVELAGDLLRQRMPGRMRYCLGLGSGGRTGLELTCEHKQSPAGRRSHSGTDPASRATDKLRRIMDSVEVERPPGGVKIRAVKWGPAAELSKLQQNDEEFPEKLFADTEKSCLENLREQHKDLVRQLEERSRQNEELNRLNAELHQLNRDLESAAAERAISEMALKVAHEIRNPATIIGGLVRTLRKEAEITLQNQAKIEAILDKTRELEKIVGDFERLAAQRSLYKQKEDLLAIMRDSVEILRSDFARQEVALQLEHQPGTYIFKANVGMLKIALTHLLRNGLEACAKGGKVVFRIGKTPGSYVIEIEDNGAGIPPEKLEHIFEPFTTTKTGRIGLGLPIVKQIVEEHRGRIKLESRLGKGTKAILDFPLIYFPAGEARP